MKLSAVDCVSRGLVNLRANWELIPVQMLQGLLTSILVVVGFLPPLAAIGWSSLDLLEPTPAGVEAFLASLLDFSNRGGQAWVLLATGLLVSSVIWLMAMMVYCYFQAGIYALLRAGDRQAPIGRAVDRAWFRTFTVRDLRGFGALYLWRYFWLLNLIVLVSLVLSVLPLGWFALVALGESKWGTGAALGFGCGGAIPILFTVLVIAFWAILALADLPRQDSGVWIAARRALRVVGRRLGTLILLWMLWMVVMVVILAAVLAVSMSFSLLLRSSAVVQLAASVLVNIVQWVVSSSLSVALAAVTVALMRSESLGEAAS